MGLIDLFWKGYYLVSDPNKIYKKGWKDAINENLFHYFKITILFDQYKKT